MGYKYKKPNPAMSTGHLYLQRKGFLVACVSVRPRETLVSFLTLKPVLLLWPIKMNMNPLTLTEIPAHTSVLE